MNSNIIVVGALCSGLLVGAGGATLIMPKPEATVRAPTQAEILQAIKDDPSLIPAPTLDEPTQEEAQAAYREAYSHNPMRMDDDQKTLTLELGQCEKNTMGPGVMCLAAVKFNPKANPIQKMVAFTRSAGGEWVATN